MKIAAVHAGLECAQFYSIDPELQMVSIGPDVIDGHSCDETVLLDSIPVTWNLLKELLISLED